MNEYEISDYGVFNDAIDCSNKYIESISSFRDVCIECKNIMGDSSVFMGPIADSCSSALNEVDVSFSGLVEDNKKINDYLISTSSNYRDGDREASSLITSTDSSKFSSNTSSSNKNKSAIFVGDSRLVGMHNAMGDTGDVWSGKESMGLNWMKSTGVPNIENQITDGASVVVMMGVNDCQYNGDAYVSYLNDLSRKAEEKGANLYFVSVNPTSGSYNNLNSSIDNFNNKIKNGVSSNIKFIDTNSYLKQTGFGSGDGLHYDKDTYERVYSYIKENM